MTESPTQFADPTNTVTISRDDEGFERLRIRTGWERSMDPNELAQAITTTWNDALRAQNPDSRPSGRLVRTVPYDQLGLSPRQIVDLMEKMTRLEQEAEAVYQEARKSEPQPLTTSGSGPVRVATSNGHILGIHLDPEWIEEASPSDIEGEVSRTVRRALGDAQPVAQNPTMARIRAELEELFAQAGLERTDQS